jgi:hypothetical protein
MGYRNDLGLVTCPMLGGVERLAAEPLIINGANVAWKSQIVGSDATAGGWVDRASGQTWGEAGSGSSPNYGEPGPGILDSGPEVVSGGKCIQAPNDTVGQADLDDMVIELVFSPQSLPTNGFLYGKRVNGGSGWSVQVNSSGQILLVLYNAPTIVQCIATVLSVGGLVHALAYVNRDENSVMGCYWLIQGVGKANANPYALVALNLNGGSYPLTFGDQSIAFGAQAPAIGFYCAMTHGANMIQAGVPGRDEMIQIAKARAALCMGKTALHNHASLTPSTL